MMFEFNMAELLRHRWGRLRLYRFPGSVLTDYRILKNYAKTLTGEEYEVRDNNQLILFC